MISQKHMTIREARNEIASLENELELYATKRQLNFEKTQPGAAKIKDIIVDSSHVGNDIFLNYTIKDEDLDVKITGLLESIKAYQEFIKKEINKNLENKRKKEKVIYLKNECCFNWKDISSILGIGEKQCRRLYGRKRI